MSHWRGAGGHLGEPSLAFAHRGRRIKLETLGLLTGASGAGTHVGGSG